MSEFIIGIPKQSRTVKVEKYPNTPVFTMQPLPSEGSRTYKFNLNKRALQVLANPTYIAIATKEGGVYILDASNKPEDQRFKITQKGEISSRPLHKYLCKRFRYTGENAVEFELLQSNEVSTFFALIPIVGTVNELYRPSQQEEVLIVREDDTDMNTFMSDTEQMINEIESRADPVESENLF